MKSQSWCIRMLKHDLLELNYEQHQNIKLSCKTHMITRLLQKQLIQGKARSDLMPSHPPGSHQSLNLNMRSSVNATWDFWLLMTFWLLTIKHAMAWAANWPSVFLQYMSRATASSKRNGCHARKKMIRYDTCHDYGHNCHVEDIELWNENEVN